jgi:dihydroorotate dehydrogenase
MSVDRPTRIAGVDFPNPFIVGSCSMTNDTRKILELIGAGAGGVVTKTISPFALTTGVTSFVTGRSGRSLAVAGDPRMTLADGCRVIGEVTGESDVPIIANVIGRSIDKDPWVETCQALEAAGAAMVELDLNCHPEGDATIAVPDSVSFYNALSIGQDPDMSATVVADVAANVGIPVVAKMTLRAADILGVAAATERAGAAAVSGVNTLHGVADVDIFGDGRPCIPGHQVHSLSAVCGPDLRSIGMRWTALICKYIGVPYISGSGIDSFSDCIQRIMYGAHAVAVCSLLYLEGPGALTALNASLDEYLDLTGISSLDDIRGRAGRRLLPDRSMVERVTEVPQVADAGTWSAVADDVYRRCRIECRCIGRDGDTVTFDALRCTGCGLPQFHAPAGTFLPSATATRP